MTCPLCDAYIPLTFDHCPACGAVIQRNVKLPHETDTLIWGSESIPVYVTKIESKVISGPYAGRDNGGNMHYDNIKTIRIFTCVEDFTP